MRVMQAISQHQIDSFNQMRQSMKDISKEVKKKKRTGWEDTDEDEDSDDSNYQDAPERLRICRIRKRIPSSHFQGNDWRMPRTTLAQSSRLVRFPRYQKRHKQSL